MKLEHKQPCSDCPFRRDSERGFLGGSKLEDWLLAWRLELPFPCHNTVSNKQLPSRPDSAMRALANAAYCVGALVMMRNSAKCPRRPDTREDLKHIASNETLVFSHIGEFEKHHTVEE